MGTCCCSEFGESYEDSRRTRRTRCSSKLTDDWKQQSHGNAQIWVAEGPTADALVTKVVERSCWKCRNGMMSSVSLWWKLPQQACQKRQWSQVPSIGTALWITSPSLIRWDTLGKLLSVLSAGACFSPPSQSLKNAGDKCWTQCHCRVHWQKKTGPIARGSSLENPAQRKNMAEYIMKKLQSCPWCFNDAVSITGFHPTNFCILFTCVFISIASFAKRVNR